MFALRRWAGGLVAAAALVGACRDAQTEGDVTTRTSAGETVSPSGDSADKRGVALIRVVNAAPTTEQVIVRSDPTHQLAAVDYKAVTPYQPIDQNWATFEISTSDSGAYEPLATNREMLTDGFRYTIVVMQDANEFTTRILRDEISDDMTVARLRIVHAARGIDEVNIVARGGDTLFTGVNFTSEAGFRSLEPWNGTLEVRTEDGNRLLLAIPNVSLQAGRSHTIVLTRNASGKLEAIAFDDSQM
jgi:hypothetical protein